MHPIVAKTFGGLSKSYYLRQLFFGMLFLAFIIWMTALSPRGFSLGMMVVVLVNTFLYPYARFVYESVIGFIMGDNVFFVNAFFMMFVKVITMALCWGGAVFIAPVGLAYLYYHHSKTEA